jgi:hypothetical protein
LAISELSKLFLNSSNPHFKGFVSTSSFNPSNFNFNHSTKDLSGSAKVSFLAKNSSCLSFGICLNNSSSLAFSCVDNHQSLFDLSNSSLKIFNLS